MSSDPPNFSLPNSWMVATVKASSKECMDMRMYIDGRLDASEEDFDIRMFHGMVKNIEQVFGQGVHIVDPVFDMSNTFFSLNADVLSMRRVETKRYTKKEKEDIVFGV